ncbi:YIP1 family protein [Paenibacillus sp. GCM10027626]|uniref:YIP1 family protein n=1 Tax=Paenibacillus sp. GCM10027626 TaxID=3273411 RepID=UPI00363C9F2C
MIKHANKIMIMLGLLMLLFPSFASAQIPYTTWFKDPKTWKNYRIQPLFVPDRVVDGNRMDMPLNSPSDLYIAKNNHVYIADTGNNRIVELDADGQFLRSIGGEMEDSKLSEPEGVFVTEDGTIYVANAGGQNIVVLTADGQLKQVFGKPDSKLLGDDYHFIPTKLVVDNRGVMYIVVKDTHQGLLRMNPQGEFTGFFGANKTSLGWMDRLKRMVLNKEQMSKEVAKRPNAIENISLTGDGFIITASSGDNGDGQIRKLNAGGVDGLKGKEFQELQLIDVVTDSSGFMYGLNREWGDITIYDPTGEAMFYFGAGEKTARQQGITSYPTSIGINDRAELWVADSGLNLIHVFKQTPFGSTFLKAAHLYFEGEYEESQTYWEALLRENGMLDIAFNGLGKNLMHEQSYQDALEYFKQSHDPKGYSDAFWNIRYDWMQNHLLLLLLIIVIGLCLIVFAARKYGSKLQEYAWPSWLRQYSAEIRDAIYLIFHPYEGFYRLKDRRISWVIILFLLGLALGAHIYYLFGRGFISFPYDRGELNIKLSIGMLVVPWLTWVLANYLVSTVKGGEGRFREVIQSSTYAIVPYIVMIIPITLLSNVLVFEEWVIIELATTVMWIWIALLLFVMTQVIHNFDFFEAVKNAGITIFTIGVIWIFIVIVSGLSVNLYDFMVQIYREVSLGG